MNKHLNLSGLILSFIVNMLVCFSALFNFFLPAIYSKCNMSFVGIYIIMPFILVLGAASLVLSLALLLSFLGICKKFKYSNLFPYLLMGINILNLILYTIFIMIYGFGIVVLNGLMIFALLATSTIFLLVGTVSVPQTKSPKLEEAQSEKEEPAGQETPSQNPSPEINTLSPEDNLDNKIKILSSMKNIGVITEEEFSEIKKKLVYDYLTKRDE